MQITETLNAGLKREIKVVVPKSDMESRLVSRLNDARGKARINGFRPGKVPIQHLRKVFGKSFMAEVVNEILNNSTRDVLAERGEKAAMQPEVQMTEDEKEAEAILAGQKDFEFSIAYEVIPTIELKDVTGIKVTRQVLDLPEAEIEAQMERVAESARSYEPKKGKAEEGDRVTIDFVGKTITVTFPESYQAAHLAGKEATFAITVKEVAKPGKLEINDDVAKTLGLDSVEKLREIVKSQLESQYGTLTRQKVKRELLDALDESYKFEAPSKLVEAEFNNIWTQVMNDLQQAGKSFADEETTEEEARAEYQGLAERRVRLGLVLAEMGEKAGIQITDEEMQRALFEFVRRYPGQEQEVYDFYRNNPTALANLRAPLFEEKVVDHLLTQVEVTDVKVSKEELLADDDEEGDVKAEAKKAAPKKKAPAKKKAAKEGDAE